MRYLRELLESRFQRHLHLHGLRQARARNAQCVQGDVALIEVRHELTAHLRGGECSDHDQEQRRRPPTSHRMRRARRQHWLIGAPHGAHQSIFTFADASADEKRDRGGHESQRQQQCGRQGEHDGDGHRVEHLPFDARQREDRQIDDQDDDDAEYARPDHLPRCFAHDDQALRKSRKSTSSRLLLAEPAQAVLDDDHGAIDDQAEVQRAQTHQVARYAGAPPSP